MNFNYEILPTHMQHGAKDYIERGLPPGSFMRAVLENNFLEAFGRADQINTAFMRNWADWLYNHCPSTAKGTKERVDAWIKSGGILGQLEKDSGPVVVEYSIFPGEEELEFRMRKEHPEEDL